MSNSIRWRNPRDLFYSFALVAAMAATPFSSSLLRPADTELALGALYGPVAPVQTLSPAAEATREALAAIQAETVAEIGAGIGLAAVAPESTPVATLEAITSAVEVAVQPEAAPVDAVVEATPEPVPDVAPAPPAPPVVVQQSKPGQAPLAWGAKVSPEFRDKVRAMCGRLGCQPDHMMAAMAFESVETFDPAVRNPMSGATGLIQFMSDTARHLGTSQEKLAEMTPEDQLVYVEKYFQPYRGRLSTLEDVYMAILWPRAVGQPNTYVLFTEGTIQYTQNAGLDADKDGEITKRETAAIVTAKLNKGLRPQYLG